MTKILLWNSGIWITIRPPQNEDIIKLYTKLVSEIEIMAETTSLYGLSNINGIFYRVIWDYLLKHLIDSSLNVPPKHLANYISVLDLDTILIGILSQIFYNGYTVTLVCKNNYVLDDNKNPKCNFSYDAKLDLSKLVWVDTSKLTPELIEVISKRRAKSQTPKEVEEYRKKLELTDNKYTLTLENGKSITFYINIPTIDVYFKITEMFYLNIKKALNEFLANLTDEEKEDPDTKNRLINTIIKNLFLTIYEQYISKIVYGDYVVEKRNTIHETLKIISNNVNDTNKMIEKIENFITLSTISTVAIPNFICPDCGASQANDKEVTFQDLVPVNAVSYFFTLSRLHFMKLLLEKAKTK